VSHVPIGSVDSAVNAGDTVRVAGWAIDPDTGAPIAVHVYVDGVATAITANASRPDLAPIFPGYGAAHGFTTSIDVAPGPHSVCVYAIDVGPGATRLLGCRTA